MKLVIRWLILVGAILSAAGLAGGQSLEQLVREASEGSESLQQAILTAQQADLELARLKGEGWPQVEVAFGSRAFFEPALEERLPDLAARTQSRTIDNSIRMTANQPIYQFGFRIAQLEAAKLNAEAAWINVAVVQRDLYRQVASAYISARGAADRLGLYLASQTKLETLLAAEERRMQQGFADANDVLAVASEVTTARLDVIRAQQELELALSQLRILTLRSSVTMLNDDLLWLAARVPSTLQQAKLQALHNHPRILVAEKRALAALQTEAATHRSTLPQLSWSASHERGLNGVQLETSDPTVSQRRDTEIGLALRVPLFRGGSAKAQRQSAKLATTAAIRDLASTKEQVLVETEQAWLNLDQFIRSQQSLTAMEHQEVQKLANASRLMDAGFLDARAVLQAELSLARIRQELTRVESQLRGVQLSISL